MYKLFTLLFLTSCSLAGVRNTSTQSNQTGTERLVQIHNNYLSIVTGLDRDSDGWFYGDSCDGILFESLLAVGSGQPSDIQKAMIEPGHYYRNPSLSGCDHDISRDMLLGVYWFAWDQRRLDIAEELWQYGSDHNWKMGAGDTRTILTPGMVGLLAKLIHALNGADHPERFYTETQYSTDVGYQSHLTMLHILLDGELNSGITDKQLETLEKIARLNSENPLAQAALHVYTDGNHESAASLILGTWPVDRLPTTKDWCEEWRTQRKDHDSGFQPCSGNSSHSGGDLLFVLRIIRGGGPFPPMRMGM